jgi:hypothetical protein
MIKFRQIILITIFVIGVFLSTVNIIVLAEPVVGDIILTPRNPAPQSDVTFSVDIDGNDVSSVKIIISECNKEIGICHAPPQNVSMKKIGDNSYEAKVTLKHDDVTSITYHVEINSGGKWVKYDEYTTALSINSGDSDSIKNDSNGTPGFEIIVFLIAIIFVVTLFKKVKSK